MSDVFTRRGWLGRGLSCLLAPAWTPALAASAAYPAAVQALPGAGAGQRPDGASAGLPWAPQLARVAPADVDPAGWLVSEKLDGVRALWDGRRLWLRGGTPVAAPAAFVAALPPEPMDGELWAGRGGFEAVSGAVRRAQPLPAAWADIRFQVFDLPLAGGPFADRAGRLRSLARARPSGAPWAAIEQTSVDGGAALRERLARTVAAGGEGLVLHRADAPHQGGRSGAVLKLKPVDDAEAVVIGHEPGRGRHAGRLGALRVRADDGTEFRLGTGLSDAERDDPPPAGARVTFTYQGRTEGGVPRFARYLRRHHAL